MSDDAGYAGPQGPQSKNPSGPQVGTASGPSISCGICPRHCRLMPGATGCCRARMNRGGRNVCANYGRITSLAMDPIEKKPLAAFYPGSQILSCGSYGCNLACPFCQNSEISQADGDSVRWRYIAPEEMATLAMEQPGNLGLAFTYNEPLIAYEYIVDVAKLIKPLGKKTAVVTAGCVAPRVMEEVLPWVDAMNIDLKGGPEFYRELGGDYDTVRAAIEYAASGCHLEVTTLVIPGKNDEAEWIEEQARWLALIDPRIVLHLTRYFPRYRCSIPATPVNTLYALRDAARRHLDDVRIGNV